MSGVVGPALARRAMRAVGDRDDVGHLDAVGSAGDDLLDHEPELAGRRSSRAAAASSVVEPLIGEELGHGADATDAPQLPAFRDGTVPAMQEIGRGAKVFDARAGAGPVPPDGGARRRARR